MANLVIFPISYVKRLHKMISSQPRACNGPPECQLHLLIASEIVSDFINPFFLMFVAVAVTVHFAQFMCQMNRNWKVIHLKDFVA